MSRIRSDFPISCPKCGASFKLSKQSGNIITVITIGSLFGYVALIVWLLPPLQGGDRIAMLAGASVVAAAVRVLAISVFGKIAPSD